MHHMGSFVHTENMQEQLGEQDENKILFPRTGCRSRRSDNVLLWGLKTQHSNLPTRKSCVDPNNGLMLNIDILHDGMSVSHKAGSQLLYQVNYFGTSQETVLTSADVISCYRLDQYCIKTLPYWKILRSMACHWMKIFGTCFLTWFHSQQSILIKL